VSSLGKFAAVEQFEKLKKRKEKQNKKDVKLKTQTMLSISSGFKSPTNFSSIVRKDYVSEAMQKALDANNIEASVDRAEKPEADQIQKSDAPVHTVGQLDEVNEEKEKKELEGVKDKAKQNNARRTGAGVSIGAFLKKKEGLIKGLVGDKLSGLANQLVNQAIGQVASKLLGSNIGGLIGKVFEYSSLASGIESGFSAVMKKMKSSRKKKTKQEQKSDSNSQKLQNASTIANSSQAIGSEIEKPNKTNVKNIN
jgi:hypothetical protein